jgi:hypothetical protein
MNSLRTFVVILLLFLTAAFSVPSMANAGFGVVPPYVRNETLTRNSLYHQQVILVRGDPVEDLLAQVTVNVPGADSWFTFDKGKEFLLEKGKQQIPLDILVKVPDDATFKKYEGNIRVTLTSPGGVERGSVSIALGVQIDVRLEVIDKKILDFKVWSARTLDLEEGHKVWWLDFPGKILFAIKLENTGNVSVAPYQVEIAIYDLKGNKLEETGHTNSLPLIDPFDTKEITAELPVWLPAGAYKAVYKIYKTASDVAGEGEISLSVLPYGTLQGYAGYGFMGLRTGDKLTIIIPAMVVFFGAIAGGFVLMRRRKNRSNA